MAVDVIEQAVVDDLSEAISSGEIEVWMQPLVDFVKGEIVAAEALTRWNHARHGYLSPDKFIPVLEKAGKIGELDRYVWRVACQVVREHADETGEEPLPFSVNVSRAEILAPDLVEYIEGLRDEFHLPAETLRLEITETAYVEQPDELARVVAELRASGFLVEMDDFGSGYSSLNMLRNLPVDILKLDMGFLRNGESDSSDAVILNSVIRMAHGLNIPIIAEGVETIEQAEMLKTMGCRLMQGYFFAKPMPYERYFKLLSDTKTAHHSYEPNSTDNRMARLLDQRGDTAFFFSHCAGPAFVFSVSGEDSRKNRPTSLGGMYEVMLANDELYEELQIDTSEANLFQTDPLDLIDDESCDVFRRAARRALVTRATRCTVRLAEARQWIECTLRVISVDDAGGVLVCYVRDATEESELRHVIGEARRFQSHDSARDELTGSLTYHSLESLVMGGLGENGGTLLLVDVDDYDSFVMSHGQADINALAEHTAYLLSTALPKHTLLARCGECLFAVFLPLMLDSVEVRACACAVIDELRSSHLLSGDTVTFSLGLSSIGKGTSTRLSIMYRRALRALTIAKLNGGDGFLLYDTVRDEVDTSIKIFDVPLRHAPDGELLPEKALEGTGLFDVISRDFEERHDWDLPEDRKRNVREAVFGALRYRSMAEVPGVLSFDYDVTDDTIFLESVSNEGSVVQRSMRGFHGSLFGLGDKLAEESMARLSSLLSDLEYLPAAGSVDLKCRLHTDREFRWYRFSFTSLRDDKSFVVRGLGYGEDIDLSRESGLWWKDRAMHDGLTGLLNREGLEDAIDSKLAKRPGGIMFMVDIDKFKLINDSLGHLSGDSVLCEVADTLRAMFREYDVIGRFGSDQMIAFISNCSDDGLARSRAKSLLSAIADIEVGDFGNVSASVGAAIIEGSATFYDFLELSDHAVHDAKSLGGGRFVVSNLLEDGERIHQISDSPESHHSIAGRHWLALN